MNFVYLAGKRYPLVRINFPFGEYNVSSIDLNECLMNSDGSYVSDEARLIDEEIFYYVDNNVLLTQKLNDISDLILSEI